MKVGDELLCIKERLIGFGGSYNIKGNTYKIININKDDITVSCETNIYHLCAHYSTYNISSVWSLSEYFISIKEIRKLKLQKLKHK
jgi:hypothetical protein